MDRPRLLRGNRGLTLVELLVAAAILGVILLPVTLMFISGYKSSYEEKTIAKATDGARSAITMMIDDLRKYDYANSTYDENGVLVKHAADNVLTIKEDLVYAYDEPGLLKRNGEVICEGVKVFTVTEVFDGFESNVIHITLKVQADKNDPGQDIELKESYWRRVPVNR